MSSKKKLSSKRNTMKKSKQKSKKKSKQKQQTKYTYLFMGPHFENKKIKKIVNKRGSIWEPFNKNSKDNKNINPDFLFTDTANHYKYKNEVEKYNNITLKNNVDLSSDNFSISNKYNLNKNMRKYNNKSIEKYVLKEFHIDLYELYKSPHLISKKYKKLFTSNKTWILKPVYGYAGKDIQIVDNFNRFKKIIQQTIIKNKTLKKFNREIYKNIGINRKEKYNIEWILQEYINNPLLIDKKKIHLRVYYIYNGKKGYILDKGEIATAENLYIQDNYYDNSIHDTHFYKNKRPLYFPDDLVSNYGEKKYNAIFKQIVTIFKGVHKCISAKCYSESKHCFYIFGGDIMITDDFNVKLIEVNQKPAYSIFNSNKMIHHLIENIMETIVDKHFPPSKKVKPLNNLIDVSI